jgi:hypothetical protein
MERRVEDRPGLSPIIPNGMMVVGWQMMQLPPILMAAWWHQMMQNCLIFMPHAHHHGFHEAHEQLVVPEPLEEDDEHALFA